jgi:hypothetical protein
MSLRRRVIHAQETYRFSMTHTLSDYPLLIGEILRRDELRAVQQAKRHSFLRDLGRALGMRLPRSVGTRKNGLITELAWHANNGNRDELRIDPRISSPSEQGQNGH